MFQVYVTVQQPATAKESVTTEESATTTVQKSVDPDANTSVPVEKSASAKQSVSGEKSAITKESVTVQQSATAKESLTTQKSATIFTIRDYRQRFIGVHNKTVKVRNSRPTFLYHRPRMQMPNKGKPSIFFSEGINSQSNVRLLLCPGRTDIKIRSNKNFRGSRVHMDWLSQQRQREIYSEETCLRHPRV